MRGGFVLTLRLQSPQAEERHAMAASAQQPIDLYYWPTPNGWKITIMLEEAGLPYTVHPVNIGKGDQFKPDFLEISPNNKMPAIVDPAGSGRKTHLDLRIRRDPAISRPQDGPVLPRGRAPARRSRPVAVLADGRLRPDAGPDPSFPHLRARTGALRDRPLHQRDQPALRCSRQAAGRGANSWRANIPSPTWRSRPGRSCGSGRGRTSTTFRTSSDGSKRC